MAASSRRSFLRRAALAAAATPLVDGSLRAATHPAAAGAPRRVPTAGKKILVLGGTGFLGPHFVRAARAAGHTVTLFNRGRTNPGLFPDVEHLRGQRRRPRPGQAKDPAQDLTALADRSWDCVLDTSGYYTGEVEDACQALAGRVQQYVYISSLSVYATLEKTNAAVDEDSPLLACADRYTTEMGANYENYGGLKRHCEDAVRAAFPNGATLVRPGYIVGPGDPTDRFTYWPARFDRGGECLAPGAPDNELQFVDVRDLGAWLVTLCGSGTTGAFNAVGFDGRISTAEFLHTGKGVRNHGCTFTWVDDAFLLANGVTSWDEMGCWTPTAKNGHADNRRAIAAGATFRPIAETIRDTADWVRTERGERPWRAGMTPERERDLLAKWRAR